MGEEQKTFTTQEKITIGSYLLTELDKRTRKDIELLSMLTAKGAFDEEIRYAIAAAAKQIKTEQPCFEVTEAEINEPYMTGALSFIKAREYKILASKVKEPEEKLGRNGWQKAAGGELLKVRRELKNSNAPHHLGTVGEIAARYNISKSEVRRRKADGTLQDWIEETFHKKEQA